MRAFCRDRECRTLRLLVPNQASHPATISRLLFVTPERIELPPHGPKPCVLTVIRRGNICGSGETRTHNSLTYYCFSRAAPHPAGSLPFALSNMSMNSYSFISYYAIIYETYFQKPNLSEKKDSNLFYLIRVLI